LIFTSQTELSLGNIVNHDTVQRTLSNNLQKTQTVLILYKKESLFDSEKDNKIKLLHQILVCYWLVNEYFEVEWHMYVSSFTLKQAYKILATLTFLLSKAMATVIDPQILFQAHTDLFKGYLTTIKSDLTISPPPSIFVSYSHDDETHKRRVESLCENLISIGISSENIIFDQWSNRPGGHTDLYQNVEKIFGAARVILIGSALLKRKYEDIERGSVISHEINLLRNRIVVKGQEGIIPVWFEGDFEASFPAGVQHIVARSLSPVNGKVKVRQMAE
jgi:hypothetical protein